MRATRRNGPSGFTLVELLVVITIIALISAVALPTVLPALNERRISESARLLQAILAGTRDAAIRANAPRGIRLLPDPVFRGANAATDPLASNRIIQIEPGPDYTEGLVRVPTLNLPPAFSNADPTFDSTGLYLRIGESGFSSINNANVPNNPTGWYNNIRQGDKLRFDDSGPYYTIAGPVNGQTAVNNQERFTIGIPSPVPFYFQTGWVPQYLNLTNGIDDNGNGWIDESCDGIDNDGDGIVDPGFNGLDDDGVNGIDDVAELRIGVNLGNGNGIYSGTEYEKEVFIGSQASSPPSNEPYTIYRRPVVSPGAREVTLPAGVVVDLTTWNASTLGSGYLPERSRLPVDPYTRYVDIMIDQSGRVITAGAGSDGGGAYRNSPLSNAPFYHFWLTDREGVVGPVIPSTGTPVQPFLPMPKGTPNYPPANATGATALLTGERRLVTLFVKTGQIVSNSIEFFNATDVNAPYYDAQAGIKESQ